MSPGADVEQGDVVPAVPARAAQGDELLVLHYQAHLSLHCHHGVMVSSCHDSVIIMACSLSQCRNVPRTPDTILGTGIGGNFGSTTGCLRRVKSVDWEAGSCVPGRSARWGPWRPCSCLPPAQTSQCPGT